VLEVEVGETAPAAERQGQKSLHLGHRHVGRSAGALVAGHLPILAGPAKLVYSKVLARGPLH
jgi:hypothetical protein